MFSAEKIVLNYGYRLLDVIFVTTFGCADYISLCIKIINTNLTIKKNQMDVYPRRV